MKLDLVDVFGNQGNSGNPLAVVHNAAMNDDAMLALTRWIGFSETTFLVPTTDPAADYQVRIFTPAGELPFAGHPTLGSCHAWLAAGGVAKDPARIMQQCGVGLVPIARSGDSLEFRAPPLTRSGPMDAGEAAALSRWANISPGAIAQAVYAENGPKWRLLHLNSAAEVLAVDPPARAKEAVKLGLVGATEPGSKAAFEVRAFITDAQGRVIEDPVTGSLNAAIAQYLLANGLTHTGYIAAQGRKTGKDGRVYVRIDAHGDVWVGGRTATVAAGAQLI